MDCGRELGGRNEEKLGICPAYPDFGHSCWGVAGSVCGGEVSAHFPKEGLDCVDCDVYKAYERLTGVYKVQLEEECPEECQRFQDLVSRKTYGFPDKPA